MALNSVNTNVGALVALERFQTQDPEAQTAAQTTAARAMVERLDGIPGLTATVVSDPVRPIPRVRVTGHAAEACLSARALVGKLEAHDPSIRTRNHALEQGTFDVDFRTLRAGEADEIAVALRHYLG